nr:unnamed protein product [Callosobruchus chinensis]
MPLPLTFCVLFCLHGVLSYNVTSDTPRILYGELFEELESKPFVERLGYKFEKVPVTTEDGYILELHHVYINTSNTKPVLIMPGLMSSSADFLITGKDRSLAIRLADQGYDVWIANNRGTTYSRKHKSLDADKDKQKFWNFSFHELGYYDLPACVDYILGRTKAKTLSYIGHAQGTTEYFVMASTRPEYNSKINVMVALGPVAFMNHITQPFLKFLENRIVLVEWIQKHLDIYEFFKHQPIISIAGKLFCGYGSKYQWICELFYSLFQGFDIAELDKYDYGILKNLEVYKQSSPPDYDVSKITSPVALLYGLNDRNTAPKDVEALSKSLKNVKLHKIEKPMFTQADFLFAKDNDALVNFEVINILNRYNGKTPITTPTTAVPTRAPSTKRPSSGPRTTEREYTEQPPVSPTTAVPHTGSASQILVGFTSKMLKPFVEHRGYKFERIPVTTDDGYILELHHVYLNTSSSPVLIMPGLMSSSADFLVTGKNRSLAMRLADQGFHELGYYDSPACVDYILDRTKTKYLSFIGHSQGTTQYFAMASTRPEYNSKVNVMVALAPVAFMTHMRQPWIQFLKYHIILVEWLRKHLRVYEFFKHYFIITVAGKLLCREGSKVQWICVLVYSFLQGFDMGQLDTKLLPTILENFPAGSALKEHLHYLQGFNSERFAQYDYGVIRNLELYNQPSPPDYDISKITSPVAMLYGKNDLVTAPRLSQILSVIGTDVENLAKKMPNLVRLHKIEKPPFSHGDFIFAKDNDAVVNFEVINILNQYNGKPPMTTTTTTTSAPTTATPTDKPTSGPNTTKGGPTAAPQPTVAPRTGSASQMISSKMLIALVMVFKIINFV